MQLTLHVKIFIKFSTLEKDRLKQNVPKARAHHIELNRQTQNWHQCHHRTAGDVNTE